MPPDPCPPHHYITQPMTCPDGIVRNITLCSKCGNVA